MAQKNNTRKIHRSAIDGKFVSKEKVKRNPNTTVTETVKRNQDEKQTRKKKK